MPKRLAVPGMMIAGDAASMVNIPTLKGVHYAMHAGMYAAETIVEALKKDIDSVNFEAYDEKVHKSLIEKDLYESRNMRQPFSKGFFVGGAIASAMTVTKGNFPGGHWKQEDDAEHEMELGKAGDKYLKADDELTFDKLDSVFLSGNATRDDAPNHVRIQTQVPARGRPDLGLDVPGPGLRDPRGPAGEPGGRRSTSTSPPPTASSAARSPPRAAA